MVSSTSKPENIVAELNRQFDGPVGTAQFKTLRPRKLYDKNIVTRATSSTGFDYLSISAGLMMVLIIAFGAWLIFGGGLNSISTALQTTTAPKTTSTINTDLVSIAIGFIPTVFIIGIFFLMAVSVLGSNRN